MSIIFPDLYVKTIFFNFKFIKNMDCLLLENAIAKLLDKIIKSMASLYFS